MPAHSPRPRPQGATDAAKAPALMQAPGAPRRALPAEFFLGRLAEHLHELGLSVSFWDSDGSILTAPNFRGQFCCLMCGQKAFCLDALSQLARKVARQGRRESAMSPSGCCIFAVPLYRRRRLIGAAVGGFPTLGTVESEEFLHACNRTHLDTEAMASLCRQEATYTEHQAETMSSILEWIIQSEQANEVAREELATLSANLANTYEELSLLYSISSSMKVTHGTTGFFEKLCDEILEVMHVQSAAVVLHPRLPSTDNKVGGQARENNDTDDPSTLLRVALSLSKGDKVVSAGELLLPADQLTEISRRYIAPRAVKQQKHDSTARVEGKNTFSTIVDNRFSENAGDLRATAGAALTSGSGIERIHTLAAAPLMIAGKYQGVVVAFNKIDGEFDSADLKLISSISGQAAVFLENHYLYEDVQDLLMGVLHALTASIDAKDPYTCGHSQRVALISRKLAQLSGFDEHRIGRIYLAGLLHDIGKIGVPEAVLQKAGKLTDAEYDDIKLHPGIGATILGGIRQMEDLIPVILHHHERLDGGGYPTGLLAGGIPIEALIVGLADSFDAMTSSRIYRGTMPLAAVITEIRRCSGTQFDPRLAELLLSLDLEDFLTQIRTTGMGDSKAFENSTTLSPFDRLRATMSGVEGSRNANGLRKQ